MILFKGQMCFSSKQNLYIPITQIGSSWVIMAAGTRISVIKRCSHKARHHMAAPLSDSNLGRARIVQVIKQEKLVVPGKECR